MKLWLNIKDLFSFRPNTHSYAPPLLNEIYKEFMFEGETPLNKAQIENIRFDNSMRIMISLLALAGAFVLWAGNVIPSIGPVVLVFVVYSGLQTVGGWLLTKSSSYREINFAICTVDIVALSLAVHWTGHVNSPLYFIYFMPLIIQAFHRDWALLVTYGVGGLVCYTIAIAFSIRRWDSESLVGLCTRMSFMACTVGIALLAVNLLRQKEVLEKRRISRLKCLVYFSQLLNGVGAVKDLPSAVEQFVKVLNVELAEPLQAWSRILLIQSGEPLMKVIQDSTRPYPELKQSIPINGCPAIQGNRPFSIKDTESESGCPIESFSIFRSHICLPIFGESSESFGVIFSASPKVDAFPEEDIQFLQFIGKSLGLAVQRLKRVGELNQAFEMDSCAMATFVGSTRTLEDTYAAITEGIRTILNVDQVNLMMWNPNKGKLETQSVVGVYNQEVKGLNFSMGEGIPGRVLESGKPHWTYNLDSHPLYQEAIPFRGTLCVPLLNIKGDRLGVVTASVLSNQRTFSIEEIDLITTFCTRASLAIENARLHLKERNSTAVSIGVIEADKAA